MFVQIAAVKKFRLITLEKRLPGARDFPLQPSPAAENSRRSAAKSLQA